MEMCLIGKHDFSIKMFIIGQTISSPIVELKLNRMVIRLKCLDKLNFVQTEGIYAKFFIFQMFGSENDDQ